MLLIDPVHSVLAHAVVVAHRAARLDGLLADDLLDGQVVLGDLLLRLAVHYVVPVHEVEVDAVGVAVGGVGAEDGDVGDLLGDALDAGP